MTQRRYTEKQVDAWLEGLLRTYEQQAEALSRAILAREPGTHVRAYDRQEREADNLERVIDDIAMIRIRWREYNRQLNADASRDMGRD